MNDTATGDGGRSLLLTLAVGVAFVIGGISYASGSAPEWIVVKASAGMLTIGMMGWLVLVVLSGSPNAVPEPTGTKLDITLPETMPSAAEAKLAPSSDDAVE